MHISTLAHIGLMSRDIISQVSRGQTTASRFYALIYNHRQLTYYNVESRIMIRLFGMSLVGPALSRTKISKTQYSNEGSRIQRRCDGIVKSGKINVIRVIISYVVFCMTMYHIYCHQSLAIFETKGHSLNEMGGIITRLESN